MLKILLANNECDKGWVVIVIEVIGAAAAFYREEMIVTRGRQQIQLPPDMIPRSSLNSKLSTCDFHLLLIDFSAWLQPHPVGKTHLCLISSHLYFI